MKPVYNIHVHGVTQAVTKEQYDELLSSWEKEEKKVITLDTEAVNQKTQEKFIIQLKFKLQDVSFFEVVTPSPTPAIITENSGK